MREALQVCLDGFRRWRSTPRIAVIAILALIMLHQWVRIPIVSFVKDVQTAASPWYYPFLMEDWYASMMIQIGAVLLFCDVPCFNAGSPYLLIRSGRKGWFGGQVLYVIFAALAYQFFLALSCALILLPHVALSWDWGKILYTLAQTEAADLYGIPYVRYFTMLSYSPVQAMSLQLMLAWLVSAIFGMSIFTANLYLPRAYGPILGLVLSMIPSLAINFSGPALYWISPGSWMTFSLIGKEGGSLPSLPYIFSLGLFLILLLTGLSWRKFRAMPVEVLPSIG